ncbi:MAG: flippase-like domain-containing protein [Acidobacteria bacterium]|nr:flippase-like domain-containing protein [Acidobacteriota bacterium]
MSRHVQTVAFTIAGAALFAYVVGRAGVGEIGDGVQRVGWGLAVILALAGLRFMVRAACWRLCMPADARLTYLRAFSAFLAGDAVGSVTPLGLLASEPTKIFLTRHHLATRDSVASLATENLIYAASILAMLTVAVGVVLATVPLPSSWRWEMAGALAAVLGAAVVSLRLLRGTWDERRGPRPPWRARLAELRVAVLGASTRNAARLRRAFGLEMVFHVLGVIEVWLTLQWLVPDLAPSFTQAIAFEGLNRVVTVAFKFVPFRIGVDEALSGAVAPALAVSTAAGVALAVVRKVRNLFWSGVGLAIVAAHPARGSVRSV